MKSIYKVTVVLFTSVFLTSFYAEKQVYVCNGKGSKRYHYDKKCKGLENCSTQLEKIPLSQAKEKGRTLCGYEK